MFPVSKPDQEIIVTMTNSTLRQHDAPRTFADVIDLLSQDGALSASRRRDEISALRSLARMFDKDPVDVPANTAWLRQRLKQFHPKQVGVSAKRFSNIKSSVLSAMRRTGAGTKRTEWLDALTPEWKVLFDPIPVREDRYKLSRFFRWCSRSGIRPIEVDNETVTAFEAMLVSETLVKEPNKIVRQAVLVWNKCQGVIQGWPGITLERVSKRQPWTFPLSTFPQRFQDDAEHWCSRLGMSDLFDDEVPARACRPATIDHRRFQIRMMASALVRTGYDQAKITSLACLVDVERFKAGLRYMMDRGDGRPTEAIHGLAMGLKAIARHHVKVDESHLDQLRKICARLDQQVDGHRETTRTRLAQFDDPLNLYRLLLLPEQLAEKAKTPGPKPRSAALLLQTAAAIEILLYCPMRIGNLASLRMDRHLRWESRGRSPILHIVILGDEVKNGNPLHFELTGASADIVRDYIDRGRPQLSDQPGDALFPKLNGDPKGPGDLSQQIKRVIFKETGLTVNPHLFRSLAGKIHNLVAAGDFATISHVLGDRIETVMRSYVPFEQQASLRHYQGSVNEMRRRSAGALPKATDSERATP